jgi:hypothetical protein
MLSREIDAASGAGANGGRRPTVVPAPDAAVSMAVEHPAKAAE